jgi:hypothetical protein
MMQLTSPGRLCAFVLHDGFKCYIICDIYNREIFMALAGLRGSDFKVIV